MYSDTLTIEMKGEHPFQVQKLQIGKHAAPGPKKIEPPTIPTDRSRLLNAAEKKFDERRREQQFGISYNRLLEQLGCESRFYRGDARKFLHKQIEIMQGVQERRLVVIVDESHLLSREMLEEIRFLLNYRMDSENPLALILSGHLSCGTSCRRRLTVRSGTG